MPEAAKNPSILSNPEKLPIPVEREPLEQWPPVQGELLIRCEFKWGRGGLRLREVALQFFTQKDLKPGEPWESKIAAQEDYFENGNVFRPMFVIPFTDHSTQSAVTNIKGTLSIEHFRATNKDLTLICERVMDDFKTEDRKSARNRFRQWVVVTGNALEQLNEGEQNRFLKIATPVISR